MSGKRGRKPSKDLVKSGERILAWAQVTTIEEAEIFVVASAQALYIPSLNQWGGTDQMRRLPWRVIDRAHWDIGTPVEVQYHEGGRHAGVISDLPFA